jgi:hypothetical protein
MTYTMTHTMETQGMTRKGIVRQCLGIGLGLGMAMKERKSKERQAKTRKDVTRIRKDRHGKTMKVIGT